MAETLNNTVAATTDEVQNLQTWTTEATDVLATETVSIFFFGIWDYLNYFGIWIFDDSPLRTQQLKRQRQLVRSRTTMRFVLILGVSITKRSVKSFPGPCLKCNQQIVGTTCCSVPWAVNVLYFKFKCNFYFVSESVVLLIQKKLATIKCDDNKNAHFFTIFFFTSMWLKYNIAISTKKNK